PMEDVLPAGLPVQDGEAVAVSGDSSTIVGLRENGSARRAFVWNQITGYSEALPAGVSEARYIALSRDGGSILGFFTLLDGSVEAGVWRLGSGLVVLPRLAASPALPGLTEISQDGNFVLGRDRNDAGVFVDVRWTVGQPPESLEFVFPFVGSFSSGEVSAIRDDPLRFYGETRVNGTLWPAVRSESVGIQPIGQPFDGQAEWFAISKDGRAEVFRSGVHYWVRRTEFGLPYCGAAVRNATGCVGVLNVTGSDEVSVNQLRLEATGLPQNVFGFFLVSRATGLVYQPPGSRGALCLGGSIGRFVGPGQIQNSGSAGALLLDVDLTSLPSPNGPIAAASGETFMFQAWHRDQFATATSNFTTATAVTLR
ncbi:MAG: hypothetical protein AAGG01_08975, partial [Planctomycetota bacterium]